MNKIIHHLGLDVHKHSIAVSIAPANSTEFRRNGCELTHVSLINRL